MFTQKQPAEHREMAGEFWFSGLLGAGIAVLYTALSFVSVWIALRKSERLFMLLVLGGMSVRLFLAITIFAVIIATVPVDKVVFVAGFFSVAAFGTGVEILTLHRLQKRANERRIGK